MRLVDFAEGTNARFRQLFLKAIEHLTRHAVISIQSQTRIYVRTDEPGPDDPLMIRGIALLLIAAIEGAVVGVARREGPQSVRRQQFALDDLEDRARVVARNEVVAETEREQLVGTQ